MIRIVASLTCGLRRPIRVGLAALTASTANMAATWHLLFGRLYPPGKNGHRCFSASAMPV
jgi:hypothetical protein